MRSRAVSFQATLEPTSQNLVADRVALSGAAMGATGTSPQAVTASATTAQVNHPAVRLFGDVMVTPEWEVARTGAGASVVAEVTSANGKRSTHAGAGPLRSASHEF